MNDGLLETDEYRFGPKNDWSVVVANTQALREKAFKLVHYVYIGKGYAIGPNRESGLWCTIHHLHPNTLTFLAMKAGQAAGTVSVVPDSRLGLPADIIFPERLAVLRKAARRLSEVFSLGVDEGIAHNAIDLTMHLYRLVYIAATHLLHSTDIVASVMAHHAAFYSNFLLFDEVFPDSRQSPKTGEQVIFTRMNLETMESRYARRYSRLKGKRNLHRWFFQYQNEQAIVDWIRRNRRPMTADELNYFGAEKSHALSEADSDTAAVLTEYCQNAEAARDQDR
ncbi:MAG: N-acyl amino acid synthase FeeM domain-containing protein [Syntrophales bacterium]